MASFPKSVVVVGGSLAGLFHGLYYKRHGSNVVILEQDSTTFRSGHNAGIAFGPSVQELMRQYDDTGVQGCTPERATGFAWRRNPKLRMLKILRHYTSWGLLYRILRANFDGLTSDAVPAAPQPREGDGTAEYRCGKRVTRIDYDESKGVVTVGFVGQVDGKDVEESITADFVIGADGGNSTMRALMGLPATKEYSGYVAWRGTVPETELPEETVKYLENQTTINLLKRNYAVVYVIPPDSGSFQPGSRLINWVWYYNYAESSPLLNDVLTDINSRRHGNTVPSGLVRPEVWKQHLAANLASMPPPLADLISKTQQSQTFVTKVNDSMAEKATFHNGRVVLVGDALAHFRPHFAVATEQAAKQCLELGKVWAGESTLEKWERDSLAYGRKMLVLSRVLGVFGQGGWWAFLKMLVVYVRFLVRSKL